MAPGGHRKAHFTGLGRQMAPGGHQKLHFQHSRALAAKGPQDAYLHYRTVILRRVSAILDFRHVILLCVFHSHSLSARTVILLRVFSILSVRIVIL